MAADKLTIHLTVTGADGAPRVPLSISASINAADLRKEASAKTKIPLSSLKIIFRGRLIADDVTKAAVSEYKLEDGSVVHCMGKPVETASPAPAASAVASNNNSSAAAPAAAATAPTQPALNFMPPRAAAPAATIPATATPADPLQAALQQIRSSCSPADYLTAVTTLEKVVSNIANHPMEEKYRKVKKANAAFQRRLGGRPGGDDAMKAAGFVTQQDGTEEVYMMQASADAWPKLMATKTALTNAVQQAKAATSAPAAPPALGGMPGMNGMGGMPGMNGMMPGMPGMNSPEMQQRAADFMADPAQLQAMLQNPMVQNMMRNDPRFANDPMGQQMLEQMSNNPAFAQQMSQMMRDPATMSRMQAMMQQQQGMGGFGNNMGGFGGVPANNNNNNSGGNAGAGGGSNQPSGSSGGANDEQMTEEEMIAEAIRRSLQEGG